MLNPHSAKIQTVSELTSSIRGLLETQFPFVSVAGEISNLRCPQSGHYYFTLKDRDAQLRAVLFKQQRKYLSVNPADGLAVVCRGRISLYEARGEYQLLVDFLETRGTGDLQAEFERLKASLAAQGLFDQARKRPLPLLPSKISLITSPEGAAVHDFLRTATRRFPCFPLEVFPVRVQGEAAPDEIVEGLVLLNQRAASEVIVLCRGGGSLEDLWAFNTEKVARAIFASAIPVVSAVGHEIDFTIADFVADYRAATPTAAAEAVVPDRKRLRERIFRADQNMAGSLLEQIASHRYRVASQKRHLGDPSLLLHNFRLRLERAASDLNSSQSGALELLRQRVAQLGGAVQEAGPVKQLPVKLLREAELRRRLHFAMTTIMGSKERSLRKGAALLDAVSPLAVLARGYSLTRLLPTRTVVRSAGEVKRGSCLEIILAEGSLLAEVTETLSDSREFPAGEGKTPGSPEHY